MFCSRCGVQSFYIPRSNPDGYAVTVHCIDADTIREVHFEHFDGRNWELAMTDAIARRSAPPAPMP